MTDVKSSLEVFITSASSFVTPVTQVDDKINKGKVENFNAFEKKLFELYSIIFS